MTNQAGRNQNSDFELRHSLDVQLPLYAKFLESFSQRCAGHPQDFGGMDLVAVGFFQRLDHQLAFNGRNDFQFGLTPRPLKELPRDSGNVRNRTFADGRREGESRAGRRGLAADF